MDYLDIDFFVQLSWVGCTVQFEDQSMPCILIRNREIFNYCLNRFKENTFYFAFYDIESNRYVFDFSSEIKSYSFKNLKEGAFKLNGDYLIDNYDVENMNSRFYFPIFLLKQEIAEEILDKQDDFKEYNDIDIE